MIPHNGNSVKMALTQYMIDFAERNSQSVDLLLTNNNSHPAFLEENSSKSS